MDKITLKDIKRNLNVKEKAMKPINDGQILFLTRNSFVSNIINRHECITYSQNLNVKEENKWKQQDNK